MTTPIIDETHQPLVINSDMAKAMQQFGSQTIPGTKMEKSALFIPINIRGQTVGFIAIANYERENAFSESDVRLISTVVSAMSVVPVLVPLLPPVESRKSSWRW